MFWLENTIQFFETPATGEEMTVANLLQKLIEAVNHGNMTSLLEAYAETAAIVPAFSKIPPLTKKEYVNFLRFQPIKNGRFTLKEVLIRVDPARNEAEVTASLEALFLGAAINDPRRRELRYFHLIKENGSWRINKAVNL